MEPQGLQNYSFESNKLPTCRKGGRRQGRSLKIFAAPPLAGGAGRVRPLVRFFRFLSLDGPRPCRRPLPKAYNDFNFFLDLLLETLFAPRCTPKGPHRAPKINQNLLKCFPGPSREGLETQSGKSCLPDPPRDFLICLPYTKYHVSLTSRRAPPGSL